MSEASQPSLAMRLRAPIISVIFTLVLVLLTEGALRLTGIGSAGDQSRLGYQRVFTPVLRPGELDDGTPILHTTDLRIPVQCVLRDKPENSLRVYTFGGSATAGLGYSPNVTFARHLERMLEDACPDRLVEVVNLGVVAISAKQVKTLVRDICAHGDPDLLVVYSGNNEFLEIHAAKYAMKDAGFGSALLASLHESNIWRLVTGLVKKEDRNITVAEAEFTSEEERPTQDKIIQHIEMTAEDLDTIAQGYESNIEAIATTAASRDVPLILMSVGSNWEWRGRSDLPADWMSEYSATQDLAEVKLALEKSMAEAEASTRHELLFKRALVHEALGQFEAARDDYRAAMNEDPHLRRALDSMNDRVEIVASRHQIPHLDTVEVLASQAENGIVGFDEYYDYVHFTSRGVVLTASEIFRVMQDQDWIQPRSDYDVDQYVAQRLAPRSDTDSFNVYEWTGACDSADYEQDRNLWKYEQSLKALEARLEANPADVDALIYRGNARFFQVRGRAGAEADYRAALEQDPSRSVAKQNLESAARDLPKVATRP